jgi:cystathionine beta-synthase
MVGRTPMLEVTKFDTGPCRLLLKLELANPGGSIKDRIGIAMIEEAEKRGDISPGDTLVEATAGNTGIGLALVAAQKGYKLILVLPDKMSQEKIFNLRAMGAEVILTRSDVGKGHPEYYQSPRSRAPISSISSATPTTRWRTNRPRRPRSSSRRTARSMRSSWAWVRVARWRA